MNRLYINSIVLKEFCQISSLKWNLTEGVNILSGVNGSGKSTLIWALSDLFNNESEHNKTIKPYGEIVVEFNDQTKVCSSSTANDIIKNRITFISTFDSGITSDKSLSKISGGKINSHLDWQLFKVLDKYLKFQLKIGKRAIELLLSKEQSSEVFELTNSKNFFFDTLDSLFAESGKKVDRESDELSFKIGSKSISPYRLSSGEKQLIIILTSVLIQNREPHILIMDEPEISLHHQWQRELLSTITSLNPNIQLIVATHSPALIMDGWLDRVTDISQISEYYTL